MLNILERSNDRWSCKIYIIYLYKLCRNIINDILIKINIINHRPFFFSFIFYLFSNSGTIYQEKRRRDNSLFIHCGDQPQTSRSGEVASSRNYAREQRFNEPVPCGPALDFSGFVKSHVNARFIVHWPPFFSQRFDKGQWELVAYELQRPTSSLDYVSRRNPERSSPVFWNDEI